MENPKQEGYYIVNGGKKILYFVDDKWFKPSLDSRRKLCGYYRLPEINNVKSFRNLTKEENKIFMP